jgi:hypothetical protein
MHQQHIKLLEIQTHRLAISSPMLHSAVQSTEAESQLVYLRDSKRPEMELVGRQNACRNSSCSRRKCYCACHRSQVISGSFWSLRFPLSAIWGACDQKSCINYKRASFWMSLNSFGIPYSIIASLDLIWTAHGTSIAPSLEVKRVVNWNAPAFMLIRDIRWNGLRFEAARDSIADIFDSGKGSPVDILSDGQSLLEVRI